MIDNKSYKKLHLDGQKSKRDQDPASLGISNERKPLFIEEMNNKEPPQAPDIYLFPPTIPGFSLRRKLWGVYYRSICCEWKLITHSRSDG